MSTTKAPAPQVAVTEADKRSQARCACIISCVSLLQFNAPSSHPTLLATHHSSNACRSSADSDCLTAHRQVLECAPGMRAWNARRYCQGGGSGRDLELPGNKPCVLQGLYKRIETIIARHIERLLRAPWPRFWLQPHHRLPQAPRCIHLRLDVSFQGCIISLFH